MSNDLKSGFFMLHEDVVSHENELQDGLHRVLLRINSYLVRKVKEMRIRVHIQNYRNQKSV